ncbi:MAG: PIN domain-containing protein [Candidatus Thermoplasmatota archaeon]|nr:PIN domain-containing protein [Euryarchaeota archaeon]MBU4033090.1 PIN domain-containing protein [Candidatus Thermoplasmatota archaeon]MBU4072324.1 PIN domain-containing protein [Candidatus Thermoplasmatota archaeon]MBU4143356.1 PIN domain-containing protein [Candidatus Thermoplasmatota archaeon]MBU4591182.1 PIN domain-containing protein [Candidatus Thermoplasmatota archaeon]
MVFLDSGFFVAYTNQRDQYHKHALHIAAAIFNGQIIKPYTCDYVLNESINVVRRRINEKEKDTSKAFNLACSVGKLILNDKYWIMSVIRKEHIDSCLRMYSEHEEINTSFTDLVVCQMAKDLGQKKVVTGDHKHFKLITPLFNLDEPIYLMKNDDFDTLKEKVIRKKAKPHELIYGEGAPLPST